MLSRVAESLYWMARYIERADSIARLMDVNNHLLMDLPVRSELQWMPLISIMADEAPFGKKHNRATEATVTEFLVCDKENPNSIVSCIHAARENARSIREVIPSEAWFHLNRMYLSVREQSEKGCAVVGSDLYEQVKNGSTLFFGALSSTMTYDAAYRFTQLGRYVEVADKTSRIIDVKYFILLPSISEVGSPLDVFQWMAVLKCVGALEMYRRRWGRVDPPGVIHFLLLEKDFPRSVRFCLRGALMALESIVGDEEAGDTLEPLHLLRDQLAIFENTQVQSIIDQGVHEYLDTLQVSLNNLHSHIYDAFFSIRSTPSRPSVSIESFQSGNS